MIAILDAILFILLGQKAPQLCPIQTFPGSWHCFSSWSVFLLLSYTHLSLKQGQQSLSTHILQIPKQTVQSGNLCLCFNFRGHLYFNCPFHKNNEFLQPPQVEGNNYEHQPQQLNPTHNNTLIYNVTTLVFCY